MTRVMATHKLDIPCSVIFVIADYFEFAQDSDSTIRVWARWSIDHSRPSSCWTDKIGNCQCGSLVSYAPLQETNYLSRSGMGKDSIKICPISFCARCGI